MAVSPTFPVTTHLGLSPRALRRARIASVAAVLAIAPIASLPSIALIFNNPATQASAATDADAQAALVASIMQEISNLPSTATAEDAEAAIMFAVSQSNASDTVVEAAFNQISTSGNVSPAVLAALNNSRKALASRKGNGRGTAATANNFASFGLTSLPAPSIGGGGGSTDYTQ